MGCSDPPISVLSWRGRLLPPASADARCIDDVIVSQAHSYWPSSSPYSVLKHGNVRKSIYWFPPKNLPENTDGGVPEHPVSVLSLGAAVCYLLVLLTAALYR